MILNALYIRFQNKIHINNIKTILITCISILFAFAAQSQNVGINTTTPAYTLDVNGRLRLQHNGDTSGLWFNNTSNVATVFTGMFNDTISGIYNEGWKLGTDSKNGDLELVTWLHHPHFLLLILSEKRYHYHGSTGDAGFGVFGNELRINSDVVNAATTFGYDDYTNGFTENMRLTGSGNLGLELKSQRQNWM